MNQHLLCQHIPKVLFYTDWQKKRYNQYQSCFIQAVISSNYAEINQQKLLALSCFEGISNFVQRYHQTGMNQGQNFDATDAMFEFEFLEDLDTLTDNEGTK